jgi:CsoR family transcriptional regulator, copper-sensing transcriptional repressor
VTLPDAAPEQVELDIGGMTCGACAVRVEKWLNKLDDVAATVNLATGRTTVTVAAGRVTTPPTGMIVGTTAAEGSTMRGYTMNKDDYRNRLRRVEGQVRGLQRMIDEDSYCIDVLTQLSAVTKALQSVAVGLLDEHIRHCVSDAARGDDSERAGEMVSEATRAIERLVKA